MNRSTLCFLLASAFLLASLGLHWYIHGFSITAIIGDTAATATTTWTSGAKEHLHDLVRGTRPRAMLLIEDIQSKTGDLSAHVIRYSGGFDGVRPYDVRLVRTLDATQFATVEQFYDASIQAIRQVYTPGYHVMYITGAVNRADLVPRSMATKIPRDDDALLTSQVITDRDLAVLHWIGAQDQARGDGIIRLDDDGAAYVAFSNALHKRAQAASFTWSDLNDVSFQDTTTTAPPSAGGSSTTATAVYAMYARTQMQLTGYLGTPLATGNTLNTLLTDTNAVCTMHHAFNFDDCIASYMQTVPAANPMAPPPSQHIPSSAPTAAARVFQMDVHGNVRAALEAMDEKLYGGAWMRGTALSLEEMTSRARIKCAHIEEDDMVTLGICHDTAKFYASMSRGLDITPSTQLVLGRLPNTTWIQGGAIMHLQGESSMHLQSATV